MKLVESRENDGGLDAYLLYGENVREGDASLRRRYSKACADGEHRHRQNQQYSQEV